MYKRTYDGVKAIHSDLPVGGPAVNHWANNIGWQPAPGFVPNEVADSSLIAELLEYGIANERIPDFITWHNFNLTHQEFSNGTNYVKYKCGDLDIEVPPLLISEWNAPSETRDAPIHKSFLIKSLIEISQTEAANNMIAAWQDFEYDPSEFHGEYGLLTYGALRKPAYNAVLLANELQGVHCKSFSSDDIEILTTADEDSLYILLTNYCPPPFFAAFNDILQSGRFNVYDLNDSGFIDIEGGDISYLESILIGDDIIPDSSPLNIAVNNAVELYQFYDSLASVPRAYEIALPNYIDDYHGRSYLIDDITNNMQYKYDSLIDLGRSQEDAILELLPAQELVFTDIRFTEGKLNIELMPNAVVFIQLSIDELSTIEDNDKLNNKFYVYPNPSTDFLNIDRIESPTVFNIYDLNGQLVKTFEVNASQTTVSISNLQKGVYIIRMNNELNSYAKFVKL